MRNLSHNLNDICCLTEQARGQFAYSCSSRTFITIKITMASPLISEIDWTALRDRSVIITGGASGLGKATATKFISHGAFVTIADISEDAGEQLAQKLGQRATYVHCDTTDWTSCAAAFKHCADFVPSKTIDVVVLFAGVAGEIKSLVDIALENPAPTLVDGGDPTPAKPVQRSIDINLSGVYTCAYLALHYFRLPSQNQQQQTFKKSLVLISSIFGYLDGHLNTGYNAAKFGVRGLFRGLRRDGHKVNARINNIAPSYVFTPMTAAPLGIKDPQQPIGRLGMPLPWAPIEAVVEGVGRCVVDEQVDGEYG